MFLGFQSIHFYLKNYLVYFDDGNIFHTYDINNDKFILVNFKINNSSSARLLNNSLISKNENFLEFYNIKNGLSNQELQFTVNRTR